MISAIAAIGRNRELGAHNELLWRIPDDLARFRSLTQGHPVVMGRKTFESIGRPLPGRTNIVITRDGVWQREGALSAGSIEEALALAVRAPGGDEVFVIGGAQIYAAALPRTDVLELTLIDASAPDADAFFPAFDDFAEVGNAAWREWRGLRYRFAEFRRR